MDAATGVLKQAPNLPGWHDAFPLAESLSEALNGTPVRVDNDVNVGTVTNIARQDWHALVTVRLGKDVELPANAAAKIGQTSLLGSVHLELAAPTDVAPQGTLHDGSLIALPSAGAYPTTEQTLAAVSMLLNGGGLGHVQEITQAFREQLLVIGEREPHHTPRGSWRTRSAMMFRWISLVPA